MRIVTIIGNRPQFVKAAAVSRRLRERNEELIVHTGQHYDDELSRIFFEELSVPRPDRQLGTGSGTNTAQTARMLSELEAVLGDVEPDLTLVYGDTNSTLAGALASAQARIPLAHVEAGERPFPRTKASLEESGLRERLEQAEGVQLTPPLGYLDFLKLVRHARAVLTDSGGVQKEAYLLGVQCVTLRDTTEWVETVEAGWNALVDLDRDHALQALERRPPDDRPELYGGGHAAERVVEVVPAYTARR